MNTYDAYMTESYFTDLISVTDYFHMTVPWNHCGTYQLKSIVILDTGLEGKSLDLHLIMK